MKKLLLPALLSLSLTGLGQKPILMDDLNANKDVVMMKVLHADSIPSLFTTFQLPPEQFSKLATKVQASLYQSIKAGKKTNEQLRYLDVDAYMANLRYSYFYDLKKTDFETASKMVIMMKQMSGLSLDLVLLLAASTKKAGPKTLGPAQRRMLEKMIFTRLDPNNEALFKRSENYRNLMKIYLERQHDLKYRSDTTFRTLAAAMPLGMIASEVQNPFIREHLCFSQAIENLNAMKNPAQIEKTYRDFNVLVTNPFYRAQVREVYDKYQFIHTANRISPDFSYASIGGKSITLSELRGKYVYIDVWATWCGPCKAEIPFLQKIEETYKNRNIHFVSLSVDKQEDAERWRSYVTENKLGGIQVMADKDFGSDFIKEFSINSIPRFILIDPEGKIVSADAYPPSDPLLPKQLDKLLN